MPSSARRFIVGLVALFAAIAALPAHAFRAYGVDASNNLVSFDTASPGTLSTTVPITNLVGGDNVLGIDFRPATGQLFALGSGSRLYTIDTATGAATQVGSDGAFALNGTSFGFDFNPVPDRIRVVSDADQSIRLNPNDGTLVATDGTLAYAAGDPNAGQDPDVIGSGYTNAFAGSTATTLYGIDIALDILIIQNPPNSGTLNTVGALAVNATSVLGFDIVAGNGGSNTAFASLVVGGVTGLYSIDLTTGAATLVGAIGTGTTPLNGLALEPASRLAFSAPSFIGSETSGTIAVTVQRIGSTAGSAGATVVTSGGSATPLFDYTSISTPVVFADGDSTPKVVNIAVVNDAAAEGTETIDLTLATPIGNAILGAGTTATAYILDDDLPVDVGYGVDGSGNLVRFDLNQPLVILASTPITGLIGGDTIVDIDFRPANGLLYGVGSGSRLYTIDTTTAAATQVGNDGAFTLNGTFFAADFNPVPDRLRLESDADQNLRLNPNDGTLSATDGTLAFAVGDPNAGANPNVVANAYTNNFAGTVSTSLYAIDPALANLLIQNPPNSGTLNTVVGSGLGVTPVGDVGFDIRTTGGTVNTAYATMVVGGVSGLYTVNLTTGLATLVGPIGNGLALHGLAIPIPLVGTAPTITSAATTTFTVGAAGSFTVTATGSPTPTLSVSGTLPAGVTFVPATGVLSGTPAAGTSGTYPLVFTASNGVLPDATQNFTLVVMAPSIAPVITSASATTFAVGAPGSFTVTATGSPTPTLSVSGTLPAGVTFVPATGVLSGTPAAGTAGTYNLVFTAANGVLPNATQNFTLTITAATTPPVFTSGATASFTAGVPGAFTVTASGSPAPTFTLTGTLPPGLTFNTVTGLLSGTPLAGSQGSYPVTIVASNGTLPDATTTLTIVVAAAPVGPGPGPVTPVPTLSPAALGLLMLTMLGAATFLRRRGPGWR